MAGRRTNLALAGLTVFAVLSGFAAFAVGTSPGRWVVLTHALLGLSLVVLVPWKTVIARRGMKRQGTTRWLSIALSFVAVIAVSSGVIQVTGTIDRLGPFTTMQVHVGAGLVMLVLGLIHVFQRPVRLRQSDLSRRNALRAGGVLGAAGLLYAATEGVWALAGWPGEERRFTGSHDVGPGARVPPTIWLNDQVPDLDPEGHVVDVAGRPHTVADIAGHDDAVVATLDCTGGWYATRRWSGARLDRLLGDEPGDSVVVRSTTGYWRRFPRSQVSDLWLATHLEDGPLTSGNGAPVRLVAPGRRGFWWVKWVDSVEVDDFPPWWQPPLPTA